MDFLDKVRAAWNILWAEDLEDEWTPEAICPHCGHVDERTSASRDTWFDGDGDTITCTSCGRDYWVNVSVDISFQSEAVDDED